VAESVAAGRLRTAPPSGVGRLSLGATLAVLEYCALSYRRNWRGTLFMTFLSPILFLGAMGFGLGSFVNTGSAASLANGSGGATAAAIGAVGYAAFLAPGLLAATCMQTGAFESTYPIMARLIWTKVYHAMLATPIAVIDVIAGQLSWFAIRLTLVAVAYFVVMVAFGLVHGGPVAVLVIPIGVLTGLCFAAPIAAFAATQRTDNGFSVIFRFLITPLFLFSGTFFPIEQLPWFLQPIALITPTYHGVQLTRDLTLGTASLWPSLLHVTYLIVTLIAGLAGCRLTFERALVK
jgi:lipooligosaccharide transport system permease protein